MKTKLILGSTLALAGAAAFGWFYYGTDEVASSRYGTDTVVNEQFIVAFSEGGPLEAVESEKIESEMDGTSTIVFVVDEGTRVRGSRSLQAKPGDTPASLAKEHGVKEADLRHANPNLEQAIKEVKTITIPGDLLVELDPRGLKKEINKQETSVLKARNGLVSAQGGLEETTYSTQMALKVVENKHQNAVLDLKKAKNSTVQTYIQDLEGLIDNYKKDIELAEKNVKAYAELKELGFVSDVEVLREKAKAAKTAHTKKIAEANLSAYKLYDQVKLLSEKQLAVDEAELDIKKTRVSNSTKLNEANSTVITTEKTLTLEIQNLDDLKEQMAKSRIYSPIDGLVVYHVAESSRYSGSSAMVEKGANIKKGQDIMKLPDLSKMQVELKIHESKINQVRGRSKYQTKEGDTVASIALMKGVMREHLREVNKEPESDVTLEDRIIKKETITIPGLIVEVRLDTDQDKTFKAEMTYVAPVASAAERWGSNKKVYKCLVTIKDKLPEYIRPGASATCRIFVANLPKVVKLKDGTELKTLKAPIQSVVTTKDGLRVCFKMDEKGQPIATPVKTSKYYDQTHIQIVSGLSEGDTILKAPLLHAKELNVGGGLFGYRQLNPEDIGFEIPTIATPPKPSTPTVAAPTVATKTPATTKSAPAGNIRPGGRGGSRPSLMSNDKDGDGKVSKDEVPEQMKRFFGRMDSDGDGFITKAEVDALQQRSQGGAGGRSSGQPRN